MSLSNSYEQHGKAVRAIRLFAEKGACRGLDTSIFYPGKAGEVGGWNKEDAEKVAHAKTVCRSCPVQEQCLTYAMDYDEMFGVWGGLTNRERNRLRKTWGTPGYVAPKI